MKEITSKVETITPKKAEEMLNYRAQNRNIKWRQVDALARDMISGNWKLNGESIIVDYNGRLQNGEHRLRACVKAGVSFKTVVVRGVDPESIKTIDQHQKRTTYDVFKINGIKNASVVSSIVRAIATYRVSRTVSNCGSTRFLPTSLELLEEFKKNQENYETASSLSKEVYKETGLIPPSILGMVMYILINDRGHDLEVVKDFFYQFAEKTDSCSKVIRLLRQKLYNDAVSGSGAKLTASVKTYYLIKTWNYWIEQKEVRALQGFNKKDMSKIQLK